MFLQSITMTPTYELIRVILYLSLVYDIMAFIRYVLHVPQYVFTKIMNASLLYIAYLT